MQQSVVPPVLVDQACKRFEIPRERVSTLKERALHPFRRSASDTLLNATMLGLSPREARRRFDSVIDFAELRDFIDLKIKNYSSGMLVRLAFSVMIHVDAEILLID